MADAGFTKVSSDIGSLLYLHSLRCDIYLIQCFDQFKVIKQLPADMPDFIRLIALIPPYAELICQQRFDGRDLKIHD